MGITYLKENQLFHLCAQDTSYIIHIYKGCYPMHVYWGHRVEIEDTTWYLEAPYRRKKLIEGLEPDDPMFLREFWPYEYPSYGTSDFRPPAFDLRDESGNCVMDLRFIGYEIFDGKPPLEGLPSTYCESDKEATTLCLKLLDHRLRLEVSLFYTLYEEDGVITRHTVLRNNGAQSLRILSALSMSLDFKRVPDEMIQLSGTALREHYIERRELRSGETSIESTRGISSHQQNPFIALVNHDTTEFQGDAYGVSLVYSGNFIARVSCDMYLSGRLQIGINPFGFSWLLRPQNVFCTPEVLLSYSPEGLGGMSHKFHRMYRERLYRGYFRDQIRPIVLNTWEAAYFSFDHEKIVQLAQRAAQVGVELLVLDDGWFGKRDDSKSSLGDWFVAKHKLPYGLDGLAKEVNKLGMKFGLWFEPEMVSPDSELYRQHPSWCLHVEGCKRSEWRNQLVLDLTRDEICDYIIESVSNVLNSANIEYVKWDCNRRITEPGSSAWPPEQQGEIMHRYVLGLYRIMRTLTNRFPRVLFENCASGGGRMDAGMMAYFPQTWVSDNSDAVGRLKIQYGTSLCYPPVMTTAHVSACPNHQLFRNEPLDFRGHVAYAFNLGYELNLYDMTEEEREQVSHQIAEYKGLRSLVQFGTFYRLQSPFESCTTAWMTVSDTKMEFAVWFFKPYVEAEEAYINVKLFGIKENEYYCCQENGKVYSGSVLMHLGLPISWHNGDYFSQMWRFCSCADVKK